MSTTPPPRSRGNSWRTVAWFIILCAVAYFAVFWQGIPASQTPFSFQTPSVSASVSSAGP